MSEFDQSYFIRMRQGYQTGQNRRLIGDSLVDSDLFGDRGINRARLLFCGRFAIVHPLNIHWRKGHIRGYDPREISNPSISLKQTITQSDRQVIGMIEPVPQLSRQRKPE
jgi:hypothetical protein